MIVARALSSSAGRVDMAELTVRAILFDMDGILVDSTVVVEQTWGGEFAADPDQIDGWNATFTRWEEERFDDVVEIPGAKALVAAVPDGRWAVVTSAVSGPARHRLVTVGFPTPPALIGADDVRHGKPSPDG